ncbi:MAG TPA: ADP-ribosylglycohydrolase family protein [Steroidobacteraceae bacterium]|nr:ADP-ribosylglycohydrolase family protein [Steroidobacteraceae bacterium]
MDPHPAAAAPAALPLPNCYWVLPGKLLAGAHPAGATPQLTQERVTRLLAAGVTCFLDLTHPGEAAPYDEGLPVAIGFLRKPIPDHGIPAEPGHMAETLMCLRQALRAGQIVYLHCRAGIGRTAMVAGCLLVEHGLSGEEALTELNRLWQQSPRAQDWPVVPETDEQADYVRQWSERAERAADPLLEPATLAAARGLRGRFQGAVLGLATGDAVAVATQYGRPGRFAPVGDMLGGGPFDLPRGGWSDDTAMALCLAESLIEREGFDARDQVEHYRRWQQEGYLSATGQCVGITAGTARALAVARWRRQPFSGTHDPQAQDPEPLARVAPVVLYFFARGEEAAHQAAEAARTTCQAPLVLAACRALARALHVALCGGTKAAILAAARPEDGSAEWAEGAGLSDSASAALAAALDVFGRTENFRDAVLAAANLGGNSDIVGAVAGALAGAHYSASAIPTLWRNSLMKKQLIEDCADRLLTHALLELGA